MGLKAIIDLKSIDNYFIVTSNTNGFINSKEVDFKKDNFWEVYGSKGHYQCEHGKIFDNNRNNPFTIGFDKIKCPCEDGLEAIPNVLNLNNSNFNPERSDRQNSNFRNTIKKIIDSKEKFVVLEFGD